jgi:hypothetical protein
VGAVTGAVGSVTGNVGGNVVGSVGSVLGNVGGTVATLTTYTGNTPQTGDTYARIGVAGVGLTNLGDARIANLDAAVSSRMATFTLPTNFSLLTINSGSGGVTVNTNNDKTGYSLLQTFPANFSSFSIDTSGNISLIPAQNPLLRTGTAQAGAAGTITLDASASATNGFYVGCTVRIRGGTGSGQGARVITAYVGATKVATVDWNWITTPDATSIFDVWFNDLAALNSALIMGANVTSWNGTVVATPATAGIPDINVINIKGSASVGVAGFMGLDWSQIAMKSSSTALSQTTISGGQTVASVTNVTNPVTVGGYSGGQDPATLVLDTAQSGHNTAGTIGKDIGLASGGGNGIVQGYASGQDPATLVLDTPASGHNTAGTIGHDINSSGGAADPWATVMAGDEVAGTFGAQVANLPYSVAALLSGKSIFVSNPVGNGFNFSVEMGYAYSSTYLNAPVWSLIGYPDITGETITLVNKNTGTTIATATTLVSGPSITQTVTLDLTTVQTLAFTPGDIFYNLVTTIGTDKVILSTGQLNIIGPH